MAKDIRSLSSRARLIYGLGCIALGCYPIVLGLGYFPADEIVLSAPRWVVVTSGIVFVIAGFMILLANHSLANNLLAGVLLFLFGSVGIWASLFSPSDGFSGGLLFLSQEQNVTLGRWLFGLGALISFAMCVYAIRRATSRST